MEENKQELLPMDDSLNQAMSYFSKEEAELDTAIHEIDELYNEIKDHYDQLKLASRSANGGRGILTFIQNQTGNLVALKNSKASLITNKINVKKIAAELTLKLKREQDDTKLNADLVNAVMEKLDAETIVEHEEDIDTSYIDKEDDEEALLLARINSLKESGDLSEADEYSPDFNPTIAVYILSKNTWKFIALDDNKKIIKDYPVPNEDEYEITIERNENGKLEAYDQDDKIYPVYRKKAKKKRNK